MNTGHRTESNNKDTGTLPFVVIVNVQINEERISDFKEALEFNSTNSRKEEGCLRFDVMQDKSDPTKFVFYEAYVDQDALTFHKTTAHYKKWADFKSSGGVVSQNVQKMNGIFFET